jgi:hypothetical protein
MTIAQKINCSFLCKYGRFLIDQSPNFLIEYKQHIKISVVDQQLKKFAFQIKAISSFTFQKTTSKKVQNALSHTLNTSKTKDDFDTGFQEQGL